MIATNDAVNTSNRANALANRFGASSILKHKRESSIDRSLKFFGNDNYNFNYPFAYQNFDLQGYVVSNPKESFLIKVKGDSMIGAGINNSDVLLVDRSRQAEDGSVVVAEVNGKLVVKRLRYGYNQLSLESENNKYSTIYVKKDDDFMIWGVVQSVIKTM